MTFPFSREEDALAMYKIDLSVKCRHRDPFYLADTAKGYLIDQKAENYGIFVRLSVSNCG